MYTHCQMAGFTGDQQIGLLCLVLKGLCICQGPLQGFQPEILVRQVVVSVWQEHSSFNTFWHRGHSVLPMVPEGLTSDLWNFEGGMNFPSQPFGITCVQYGNQLLPPVRCIQLVGLPLQPHLVIIDQWLQQFASPISGTLCGCWCF